MAIHIRFIDYQAHCSREDIFIGNNAIILPGVTIGDNIFIDTGVVVSRDVPSNSIAICVLARKIKTTDEFYEKLKEHLLHIGHRNGKEKD